ncbi:hypothetical protein CAI21_05365 [Alkalilimnicola ehrlichii]|uniref:Periplasmic chaperone PpiD n=1 Tax=Alkalilimnicola ehrlichii TaxID=351052 RepID=A0A3E0WYG2_9GAMM|nr:SurA N-terminal domain-containing protein [Alkalilimnicola ehrlichii]RFA30482.1 hypothetical protein CAI21_05365 [Alkalilimnicola ehrlichii]RFA38034.1 hypothetical protein CAL65_06735 [Alkalilimnicola ehrlichii]
MLLAIRDRAKGWFAWVIIVLIAIPFAFFGVYNYLSGPSPNIAAQVNGEDILVSEVTNRYRQQRQQLEAQFGDQLDPAIFDDDEMRRNALEQLINERLLAEYVDKRGLRISDERLRALVRSQEVFHEDGRFSSARYEQLLRNAGMRPEVYEARVRNAEVIEQLQLGVFGTALVTNSDIERLIRIDRQSRDFAYLAIDRQAFYDPASVTEEAMQAFYNDNQALFQRPEQVRLAYVELQEARLRQGVEVSEGDIRERYNEVRDSRFTREGDRAVRHILISVPEGASQAEVEAAREQLNQMRADIAEGMSFEDLAREYSDDPGSANRGGDLGVIRRGQMVDEFEEAAYMLNEGEVSPPVRTPFGVHLIQVYNVEPDRVRPFEEVRDRLEQELVAERVGHRIHELVEQLNNLTYEHAESLEPASEAMGLDIQHTDWFSRDGADSGLASNSAVVQQAFSDEVLQHGYNSEAIDLGGRHVVVRVEEHRPATTLPLEEVAEEVRSRLAREQAEDRARELAAELRERLEAGDSLESLAELDGVTAHEADTVVRGSGTNHPGAVVRQAFMMSRPSEDAPSVADVQVGNGRYAVIQLHNVTDGDIEALDEGEREQYRMLLQQAYGQAALAGLLADLREEANVRVYEDRI